MATDESAGAAALGEQREAGNARESSSQLQQVRQRINELGQRQKIAGAAAIALAITLLVGIFLWTRTADYAVLFSNLNERDGGEIVSQLRQNNIPYQFSDDGRAIMVPSAQVHDVRLQMAAEGLPRGGLVGFEVMAEQRLGASQFLEQVNYQRALEGELSRTVQSVSSIDSARVHLAIPKQSGFIRDNQYPSASVMVNLYPGRFLDPIQLAGIVHLISSSVPRMSNNAVSVIDQNGNLLTAQADPLRRADLDATQLEYTREIEAAYIRRIENILTPMLGTDNFKAQVTANLDFNIIEETAERYNPNPIPDQAIRSQQTTEQYGAGMNPQGVPGALTNQPPVPATAPITAPEVGDGEDDDNGGVQTLPRNRSATINYEVDRNIQHIQHAPGQLRRLSVAVVVNHRTETLPNGQTREVELTDEETQRISNLVRNAVGLSDQRGDTLTVSGAPFTAPVEEEAETVPWWQSPDMIELGKDGLKYLALLLAVAFIYFAIIRPLIRTVASPREGEERAAGAGDDDTIGIEGLTTEAGETVRVSPGSHQASFEERISQAREWAREDPRAVAALIKEWVNGAEEK